MENTQSRSISAVAEAMDAISSGLETLKLNEVSLIPWIADAVADKSIAPEILAFATGGTAHCTGGRSCARLYLALQGIPIDIRDTYTGMDLTRREWWLRAMFERATDQWQGTHSGVEAIASRHADIWNGVIRE